MTLWNAKTWELHKSVKSRAPCAVGVAFSPDGKTLFSASGGTSGGGTMSGGTMSGVVQAWDADTLQERYSLPAHDRGVVALSVSGGLLATTGGENGKMLKIWRLEDKKNLHTILGGKDEYFQNVAFSPDGNFLAAADHHRGGVQLWRPLSGEPFAELKTRFEVNAVAFSPQGDRLVSVGGSDYLAEIKFWNLSSRQAEIRLRVSEGGAEAVLFSPDGKVLITGQKQTLVFWDAKSGKRLRTLYEPGFCVYGSPPAMAISPDGSVLAVGGVDGKMRIWALKAGLPVLAE